MIVRVADLPVHHPRLLWGELTTALAALLKRPGDSGWGGRLPVQVVDAPGESPRTVELRPEVSGTPTIQIERVIRTYDRSRIVEMAGIAVAGLAAYHILSMEIVDVAARGTGADYVCMPGSVLLEVASRSRRQDATSAWNERYERLMQRSDQPCWLFVVDWESPAARLERVK